MSALRVYLIAVALARENTLLQGLVFSVIDSAYDLLFGVCSAARRGVKQTERQVTRNQGDHYGYHY